MKVAKTTEKGIIHIDGFKGLEGFPSLKSEIVDTDLVLFDYDESFTHIIQNGKTALSALNEISKNPAVKIEISLPHIHENPEHLKEKMSAACKRANIDFPDFEFVEKQETIQEDELKELSYTLGSISPMLTRLETTLVHTMEKNRLDIAEVMIKKTALSEFQEYFISKSFVQAAKHGQLAFVEICLTQEFIENNLHVLMRALEIAASSGHLPVVQKLLEIDAVKVNAAANDNKALRWAAENGHLSVVQELLKIDAVKRDAAALNNLALKWAAKKGHLSVVQELLKINAVKVNAAANDNKALREAAANGHFLVVQELLKIDAVKREAAAKDNEALREAAENGHLSVVQELLKIDAVKANAEANNNEALRGAAARGNLLIVQELLKIDAVKEDAAANNNEALRGAAARGNLLIVQELLKIDAVKEDAAALNNLALRWAAEKGHLSVVQELLKIDAVTVNAAANDNPALRGAAVSGHLPVVQELLKIDAVKVNAAAINNFALRGASASGHLSVVQELLKIDAVKVNAAANGNEALRRAAASGHLSVVQELLKIDAVKEKAAALNNEALIRASANGHFSVVQELLKIDAVKVDAAVNDNEALRGASASGHLSVVQELLKIDAVKANAKANNNEALRGAAARGNLLIVQELLKIDAVKRDVAALNNLALSWAAANGHLSVVQELLRIDAVKRDAAADDNEALRWAAEKGHLFVVQELLKIDVVKNNIAANNNDILKKAAEKGHHDVVRALLEYPAVQDAIDIDNNHIFKEAASNGHILVVKELLRYPKVAEKVAVNDNYALRKAIEGRHVSVVNELLKLPVVAKQLTLEQVFNILAEVPFANLKLQDGFVAELMGKTILGKKALEDICKGISKDNLPGQKLLLNYLSCYGYDAIEVNLAGTALLEAIQSSIENSFRTPLLNPRSHAGEILQLAANVKALKQTEYEHLAGNTESAMEESLVKQAMERFNQKVKPMFESRFTSIEAIEKKIYELLLAQKLAQLRDTPEDNNIKQFIQNNKTSLIDRAPAALAESRLYFTSNTDTVDIALRALDNGAPSHGWEKLLVAPNAEKQNQTVFSTRAAHEGSLNLLETTNITREMLCYAYLVATDTALSDIQREEIINKFICYVAEISRAHNNDSVGSDNPSCFPGTITRLDLIFQAHPKFHVAHDLFTVTKNSASQIVIKAFTNRLTTLELLEDKRALYEAITLYSNLNAKEIINNPESVINAAGEPVNLEKLLKIRKDFFESCFGKQGDEGIAQIQDKLLQDYSLSLEEDATVIAMAPMLNMGRATDSTTFSLTEAYLAATPKIVELMEIEIRNPFRFTYQEICESAYVKNLPALVKTKMAKSQYAENARKCVDFEHIYKRLSDNINAMKLQSPPSLQSIAKAAEKLVNGRYFAAKELSSESDINIVSALQGALPNIEIESLQEALDLLGKEVKMTCFSFVYEASDANYPTDEMIEEEIASCADEKLNAKQKIESQDDNLISKKSKSITPLYAAHASNDDESERPSKKYKTNTGVADKKEQRRENAENEDYILETQKSTHNEVAELKKEEGSSRKRKAQNQTVFLNHKQRRLNRPLFRI